MVKSLLYLLLSLLATAPSFAAVARNFLPLQSGNEWILRTAQGEEFDLHITVGTPLWRNGSIYYWVRGYTAQPVWVRQAENGDLYYIDPATDQERVLTDFASPAGTYFVSGLHSNCRPLARQNSERRDYTPLPGASPAASLVITYDPAGCLSPIDEERYVENLGPVYRRVSLPGIGRADYELVWARVGAIDFNLKPNRSFQLALDQTNYSRERPDRKFMVTGHVRISATPYATPVRLAFPNLKRLEIVLRDSKGREVFRYTDGQSELPIGKTFDVGTSWTMPFQFLFADRNGKTLPDGQYTVTAWLRTDDPQPQFTAQTRIQVGSIAPAMLP